MLFHVLCTDIDSGLELRARLRPSHLRHMIKYVDYIVFGGPMLNDNGSPVGSIMVMNFDNHDNLMIFLEDEPYNASGLFKDVQISTMIQMVPQSHPNLLEDEYMNELNKSARY